MSTCQHVNMPTCTIVVLCRVPVITAARFTGCREFFRQVLYVVVSPHSAPLEFFFVSFHCHALVEVLFDPYVLPGILYLAYMCLRECSAFYCDRLVPCRRRSNRPRRGILLACAGYCARWSRRSTLSQMGEKGVGVARITPTGRPISCVLARAETGKVSRRRLPSVRFRRVLPLIRWDGRGLPARVTAVSFWLATRVYLR